MYHSALNSSSVAAQVAKAAAVAAAASSGGVPYSYNNSHLHHHHHHHPMFSIPHVPGGVSSVVNTLSANSSLQNLPHLNAMSNEYGQLSYKDAKFYQTDFLTEYEKR